MVTVRSQPGCFLFVNTQIGLSLDSRGNIAQGVCLDPMEVLWQFKAMQRERLAWLCMWSVSLCFPTKLYEINETPIKNTDGRVISIT